MIGSDLHAPDPADAAEAEVRGQSAPKDRNAWYPYSSKTVRRVFHLQRSHF
jgi:hypothetical protein